MPLPPAPRRAVLRRLLLACLAAALLPPVAALTAHAQAPATPPVPGTVDPSYNPTNGIDNFVLSVASQSDGKVVIVGAFKNISQVSRSRVARLNPDGTLDETFNPGAGADAIVRAVALQPDGKILTATRSTDQKLRRFNADGTTDEGFEVRDPHREIDPWKESRENFNGSFVSAIALQPGGKMLVTGDFSMVDRMPAGGVARINADGSLNSRFNAGGSGVNKEIRAMALQPDGKLILGGEFDAVNGAGYNHIVRLNMDGSVDPTFDPADGTDAPVRALLLQPDGKVVIGGGFETVNKIARKSIARLNANGTLDTSFVPGDEANEAVRCLALQPDGKILVGGNLGTFNKVKCSGVARVNPDGTADTGFDSTSPHGHSVNCVAVQPDGKIVVGGGYTKDQKTALGYLARLNASGSPDPSFTVTLNERGFVQALLVQPDGKIVVGGEFTTVNGVPRSGIARVNADGKLDYSFDPRSGFNDSFTICCLVRLADGKMLVGGNTNKLADEPCPRPVRLNPDGTRDGAFMPGHVGANGTVDAIVVLPDGKVIVGGHFTWIMGERNTTANRNCLARLFGEIPPALPLPVPKR